MQMPDINSSVYCFSVDMISFQLLVSQCFAYKKVMHSSSSFLVFKFSAVLIENYLFDLSGLFH